MLITFYAGAADAAGVPSLQLHAGDLSLTELRDRLEQINDRLAHVLPQCSWLVDGRAITDDGRMISDLARVDVLPPFAGG